MCGWEEKIQPNVFAVVFQLLFLKLYSIPFFLIVFPYFCCLFPMFLSPTKGSSQLLSKQLLNADFIMLLCCFERVFLSFPFVCLLLVSALRIERLHVPVVPVFVQQAVTDPLTSGQTKHVWSKDYCHLGVCIGRSPRQLYILLFIQIGRYPQISI